MLYTADVGSNHSTGLFLWNFWASIAEMKISSGFLFGCYFPPKYAFPWNKIHTVTKKYTNQVYSQINFQKGDSLLQHTHRSRNKNYHHGRRSPHFPFQWVDIYSPWTTRILNFQHHRFILPDFWTFTYGQSCSMCPFVSNILLNIVRFKNIFA